MTTIAMMPPNQENRFSNSGKAKSFKTKTACKSGKFYLNGEQVISYVESPPDTGKVYNERTRIGKRINVDMLTKRERSEAAMTTHVSCVPEAIRERIFACQTENDWDDEGAIGITPQACEAAIRFLEMVLERSPTVITPKISPSVYGSVTLHWRKDANHIIVRPSPGLDLAFYRHEQRGHDSVWGDQPRLQVVHHVLTFLA